MNAQRRYQALSENLSGLSLHPSAPDPLAKDFPLKNCQHADFLYLKVEELSELLQDFGLYALWQKQGHEKIWLQCPPSSAPNHHRLLVWSEVHRRSELLLKLSLWLEYCLLEASAQPYSCLCVDELLLQNPLKFPTFHFPGQCYASSGGALRPCFALLRYLASCLGAELLTQIPQYFHTAYLFAQKFSYLDPIMAAHFKALCQQLLPHPTPETLAELSRQFEAGRIRLNGQVYLWPTEMMALALDPQQLILPPPQSLERLDFTRC